jgi:hypothetical protein
MVIFPTPFESSCKQILKQDLGSFKQKPQFCELSDVWVQSGCENGMQKWIKPIRVPSIPVDDPEMCPPVYTFGPFKGQRKQMVKLEGPCNASTHDQNKVNTSSLPDWKIIWNKLPFWTPYALFVFGIIFVLLWWKWK